MMNVNYFNDPLEGHILPSNVSGSQQNMDFSPPPEVFVKSFTLNYDNLPMWDRYADNGKGFCIRLGPSSFGRSAGDLKTSNECQIIAARVDDSNNVYRVAYCAKTKTETGTETETETDSFSVNAVTMLKGEKIDSEPYKRLCGEIQELVKEMGKIRKSTLADASYEERHFFRTIMDHYAERVSYLFKADDHKSEQELRVISYDYDLAKELQSEPFPRIAVHWNNAVTFREIMFGPRMTDAEIDSCTPYIQRKIDSINRWKSRNDDFRFIHTTIKAR
jgi:hypothetical protein